jgi:Zn-dependent peptidase ImmA (M78 family)
MNINNERPRNEARNLHTKVRSFRAEWASPDIDDYQLCRMTPEIVLERILKFKLEKVEEIPSGDCDFKVAGLVDRSRGRVLVAEQTPFETRRFTLAHEIGHLVLHPNEVRLHRDRAIDGSRFADHSSPLIEQQANIFAAELLMPFDLICKAFYDRFEGRIDRKDVEDNFAFMLNQATSEGLRPSQIRCMTPYDLARRLARVNYFGFTPCEPLHRLFGVSVGAMARQLVDHSFVS